MKKKTDKKNRYMIQTLPRQVRSMADAKAIFGIPEALQQAIRKEGRCPEAFDPSGRINVVPMLKAIFESEDFGPAMDIARSKAKLIEQQAIKAEIENLEKKGELCTRDGVEQRLGPYMEAIMAGWRKFERESGGKMRVLLETANVPAEIIGQAIAIAVAGVMEPLDAVRALVERKK